MERTRQEHGGGIRGCVRLAWLAVLIGVAGCEGPGVLGRGVWARGQGGVDLRVLLLQGPRVWVNSDSGMRLGVGSGSLERPGKQGCWVALAGDSWEISDASGTVLARQGVGQASAVTCEATGGGRLRVGKDPERAYRGLIRCLAREGGQVAVVNVVEVEDYLLGVVGSEMPSYWHLPALQSQAVACRTFALYHKHATGSRPWELGSDQGSQVYGGVERENERVRQAVEDTAGVVLTYQWQGRELIFPSFFASTCGGHTQDASPVFGLELGPLGGVECPYCAGVAKPEYYRWGPVEIAKAEASRLLVAAEPELAALGTVASIRVTKRSHYGRAEQMELVGANGMRRTMRAAKFRLALSTQEHPVRSSWYELEDGGGVWRFVQGHGWGHGVGLCQCGAEGMARRGQGCVAILNHYYPGAKLTRAY